MNLAVGAWAWAALAASLGAAACAAAPLDARALDWQPALAWHEPWRAWTAAAVHLSTRHLLVNLAGAALVGALGAVAAVPRAMAGAWLVAWPLTQLGLLLRPDLAHYGGLSGVLHAGVAVVGTHLAIGAHGPRRVVGAALLGGVALKVLSETPWGPALRHPPGWDIAVAPIAHATGLVAGIACAGVAHLVASFASRHGRHRAPRRPAP